MKELELRQLIRESIFEELNEKLCPKGKAYVSRRKAAGEKHSAYLMGRAVKVCKGMIGKKKNENKSLNEKLGCNPEVTGICCCPPLWIQCCNLPEIDTAMTNVIEGDDVQVVTPPLDATAAQHEEYRRKQEIASGWQCECGYPLANNILEDREDKFIGVEEVLLSTGDTADIEIWSCIVECSNCGKHIDMNPDDFHLLAGDDIFMQFKCEDTLYIALNRGQMKDLADAGVTDGIVLGSEIDGHKVPPWLWGCYVMPFPIAPLLNPHF